MIFTIKHHESDILGGGDHLYGADEIRIIRKGSHFEDGIYLDPEPTQPPVPNVPGDPPVDMPPMAHKVILFGGDQTSEAIARQGGRVWIMNEAGNTVASYEL